MIDIYEVIEIDDFFVYVMERPENCKDLFQIIEDRYKAKSALTEKEARKYFTQVLNANICCEENGVLHRDVKPENILIDMSCDEAKLIDFGLSSEIQEKPFTRFRGERDRIISLKVPTLSSQSISFVVMYRAHHLRRACTKTRNTGTPEHPGTPKEPQNTEIKLTVLSCFSITDHVRNEMLVQFVYRRNIKKLRGRR